MSATKLGTQTLPTNAPAVTKEFTPGVGEVEVRTWRGERTDIDTKYTELKGGAAVGGDIEGNITALSSGLDEGRSRLMLRIERSLEVNAYGPNTKLVEELYAMNVIKDIRTAPYFTAGGAGAIVDDDLAWVTECIDEKYNEAEITTVGDAKGKKNFAAWSAGMKELRHHMLSGVESYFETAFILRRSLFGVITSAVKASFTGINFIADGAVDHQDTPVFQSAMDALIESLPEGEWLYKPPQAEHTGKGKWRITLEWHYAVKWSIVYGGSFHL